ncbi:MAG: HAMP domain-containing sensor histidine kinase [Pseudomonadota bacterium]
MIEQIYLYLILVGATIGAVLATLWYQAHKTGRINLALIRLNEQYRFDTPTFLSHAWHLLSQSGLLGIAWRLDWFGVLKEGNAGVTTGMVTERQIEVAEMKLTVNFYRRDSRGERRYFEETMIETFLLLLRTDMLLKAGTTDATLSQMSKLNLFLQHDMKNIAQFIQLMADQLASIPAGKEQQVLEYLRRATPLIRHRADRIVSTLTVGSRPEEAARTIQLREVLTEIGDLYGLEYTISGEASIRATGNTMDTVLDNILKNYHDLAIRENTARLQVSVVIKRHSGQVEITIEAADAPPAPAPERLFEPFWSSDPAGLGIGLYQAKQMLELQGGALWISHEAGAPLRFHITYPDQNSDQTVAVTL